MIYVVGIGPGSKEYMTLEALETIEKCDIIIG
ncbi:MAG: cobalt-precorrin-3B C(17)-methyltransferase, partial [Peptostreptococcus sp.]|nr:cobalt-precorrin-3B C(17)-methyltransferase [Peptostreptococcus sp.]